MDEGVDVLAQVQAETAATWRSPRDSNPTVRIVERLRAWCEGYSSHVEVAIVEVAIADHTGVRARAAGVDRRGHIAYRLKRPWPDGRTRLALPCREQRGIHDVFTQLAPLDPDEVASTSAKVPGQVAALASAFDELVTERAR